MDDGPELEQRLDALYVAVRDGATVDRQAAFDIAMNELEYRPLHAEARVPDDGETRLASAAAASAPSGPNLSVRSFSRGNCRAVALAAASETTRIRQHPWSTRCGRLPPGWAFLLSSSRPAVTRNSKYG